VAAAVRIQVLAQRLVQVVQVVVDKEPQQQMELLERTI